MSSLLNSDVHCMVNKCVELLFYFVCFTDCYCSVAPWVGLQCVAVVVHDHTLLIFVTVGIE